MNNNTADIPHAALDYAARKVPVFPCDPLSKRPRVSGGFHAATCDPAQIGAWWTQWPRALIGVPTGARSGLVVLDVDVGEVDGNASLARLIARHGALPRTRVVSTPRGGLHYVFQAPDARIVCSAGKLGAGLDVRGEGGYCIAPPSVRADGRTYDIVQAGTPAPMPQWLVDLTRYVEPAPRKEYGANPPDSADVRGALSALSPDCGYQVWVEVGMALSDYDGESGLYLWDEWSQGGGTYPGYEALEAKWGSFRPGGGVGIGTLFWLATEAGWENPKRIKVDIGGSKSTNVDPPRRILSPAELVRKARPPWLVQGLLPTTGIAVVYGASGSGKSFLAIDKGLAIVRGEPWYGRRTKRGAVVYVATEGSMRNRVEAYIKDAEVSAEEIAGFGVLESGINLLAYTREELIVLIDEIKAYAAGVDMPIALVEIDTLNRAMPGGNENASEDMSKVVEAGAYIATELGCLLEFVHHTGKDEARGARGWSGLKAATDAEISIARNGPVRMITAEKVRDGEDDVPVGAFELSTVDLGPVSADDPEAEDDERYTSCVIKPVDVGDFSAKKSLSKAQKAVMKAFYSAKSWPCPVHLLSITYPPRSGQTVVSEGELNAELDAHGGLSSGQSPDSERRARSRALQSLQTLELLRVHEGWVWSWEGEK